MPKTHRRLAWTPFVELVHMSDGAIPEGARAFRNSHYLVLVREQFDARMLERLTETFGYEDPPRGEPIGRIWHLSIRRNDNQPMRDWRELQRIKNELTHPEADAVELFPAESRKVDTANQFHLWVFMDDAERPVSSRVLPFGWLAREVSDRSSHPEHYQSGATQRPLDAGDPWQGEA